MDTTLLYWILFSVVILIFVFCAAAVKEPFGPIVSPKFPATSADGRALLKAWMAELAVIDAAASRMRESGGSDTGQRGPVYVDERCAIAFERLHPAGANARQSFFLTRAPWKQPMIDAGDALSWWARACSGLVGPPKSGHFVHRSRDATDLAATADRAIKHACAALQVVPPLERMVPHWPADSEHALSYETSRYTPPHAR